jgi:hypothetical protein
MFVWFGNSRALGQRRSGAVPQVNARQTVPHHGERGVIRRDPMSHKSTTSKDFLESCVNCANYIAEYVITLQRCQGGGGCSDRGRRQVYTDRIWVSAIAE